MSKNSGKLLYAQTMEWGLANNYLRVKTKNKRKLNTFNSIREAKH